MTDRDSSVVALDSTTTTLAQPVLGLPTPRELEVIEYLGKTYHQSGLLPKGVSNWQAAVIAIQAGRELGIPPTVAIREIYVVHGRPTCSAMLMMSLVRRAYGASAIRVKEATGTGATIEYREPGWDGVSTFTFSEDDARKAGLLGGTNVNWNKYPRAMYRSRAISEVARMVFPDAILGMYTPDEMGAPVEEDGRISGTLIDHDTGEIVQERTHATATVREMPPRPRPEPVPLDPEEEQKRRLNLVDRLHGRVSHDALHGWAESQGFGSVTEVPIKDLADLANRIRTNAARDEFVAQYEAIEPEPLQDVDEPSSMFSPEEMADLNAAADREAAARKAREA